jgi:hypothetical protein
MSWRDRFHGLSELGKKAAKEAKKAEKQRIDEFQEIDKVYGHRIERVCSEFCRTFGWNYLSPSRSANPEGPLYFKLIGSSYGRDNQYGDSIEIMLSRDGVFIKGRHSDFSGCSEKKRKISFNEFSEDILAQILLEV